MAPTDPAAPAGRPISPRLYRLLTHSWGIGIGLLALWACLSFFLLPAPVGGNPAVEKQLHGWDEVYYGAYGIAGVSILAGLVGRRRCEALEAFGLCLFVAGLCVNLAALMATLGPLKVVDGMGTWLAYVLGAVGRLLIVTRLVRERLRRQVTLEDLGLGDPQ